MEIKIVDCPERGIGAARTFGAKFAKHDHLIFFDADLILRSNWIELANKSLKENSDLKAMSGLLVIDTPVAWRWIYYNLYTLFSFGMLILLRLVTGKSHLNGNNFVIEKELFEKTGGFPNVIVEDYVFNEKMYKLLKNPRKETKLNLKMESLWNSRRFDKNGLIKSVAEWYAASFFRKKGEDYASFR
jgi:glycosyltransferase involved in cell wall biosynthesis